METKERWGGRSKAAGSQPASGKGPNRIRSMCRFLSVELSLPTALHVGNGGLRREGVGEKRKEVLCLRRQEQFNLFVLRPSDHTRETPWPETFSCLRRTEVSPPKGRKERGDGGKDPSEGQEGKSLTLSGKGSLVGSPWGFGSSPRSNLPQTSSVPQGVLESIP